jgi:hypothetical protein
LSGLSHCIWESEESDSSSSSSSTKNVSASTLLPERDANFYQQQSGLPLELGLPVLHVIGTNANKIRKDDSNNKNKSERVFQS